MPHSNRLKHIRAAETAFVRVRQKADAPSATADYLAAQQALRERTRRLREQRLAREALAEK